MGKTRLEAFSDGVLAVIITIMVLEMKVPHGSDWQSLQPVLPVFLSYVLSFVYLSAALRAEDNSAAADSSRVAERRLCGHTTW